MVLEEIQDNFHAFFYFCSSFNLQPAIKENVGTQKIESTLLPASTASQFKDEQVLCSLLIEQSYLKHSHNRREIIETMDPSERQNHPLLTVSQLSNAIKNSLETTFPLIWLQGEISNCKPHTSGHLYFSLKDANAQIGAVMFRPDVLALKAIPKDGNQVIIRGEINVYPLSGKYQVVVRELRQVGLGELLLRLEELKIKLHKKGWFRSERKRSLPKFPKKIGVVTSPTGAAIQDILHILTRRFSGFHLIINPVRVQGEGAAKEIAQAIEQFNHHQLVDVLIVGRGGGSIEDLWAFNEEVVAEAIFNSRIPIICAVGHETDHCIADYVADLRAPTPSAAAELVIAEKSQHLSHLTQVLQRLQHTVFQLIRQDKYRLTGLLRHPALQTPYTLLGPWIQRLDDLRERTAIIMSQKLTSKHFILESKRHLLSSLNPTMRLAASKQKLSNLTRDITATLQRQIQKKQGCIHQTAETLIRLSRFNLAHKRMLLEPVKKIKHLDMISWHLLSQKKSRFKFIKESLDSINPKNLLTKGYCILFSEKDHSTITSVREVEKEQKVRILLMDGKLKATINEISS